MQSKCSQEMGTEGSRMGQGKAPGRDMVSPGVPFNLDLQRTWEDELYYRAGPTWGQGVDSLIPILVHH